MAFTSTDLANIEAAIVALAKGERTVFAVVNGKQIRYSETDLSKLQDLRSIILNEIGTTTTRAYARNMKRATL